MDEIGTLCSSHVFSLLGMNEPHEVLRVSHAMLNVEYTSAYLFMLVDTYGLAKLKPVECHMRKFTT